jgi:hypothetical protein
MDMLKQRVAPVATHEHDLDALDDAQLIKALHELADIHGRMLSWMPEAAILRIEAPGHPARNFSLLRNTAHLHINYLLREEKTLVPDEDTLDVLPGFATAYPNTFFVISPGELPAFTDAVRDLASEKDYRVLMGRFGVRRTSPRFWATSDAVNDEYLAAAPIEAGLLDYNRLENR